VFLLVMMAHGIIGVSVMTALLPRMSAAAADNRFPDLVADLNRGLRTVTAALAPIVVVFAVLAAPISVALFQYGAFSAENARDTATVLMVGAFAILPLSISYLFTYTFYALQGNKTVALINLPVVAIRVGVQLGLFFLLPHAFAAAGLTAGNAVSYVASAAISLMILRKRIGRIGLGSIMSSFARVFAAALVAAGLGYAVVRILPGNGLPTFWEALLQLSVGGLVIVGSYLGLALLFRVREVSQVIGLVRRKLSR
jgi:putative peptidoglycan lipid II flippase